MRSIFTAILGSGLLCCLAIAQGPSAPELAPGAAAAEQDSRLITVANKIGDLPVWDKEGAFEPDFASTQEREDAAVSAGTRYSHAGLQTTAAAAALGLVGALTLTSSAPAALDPLPDGAMVTAEDYNAIVADLAALEAAFCEANPASNYCTPEEPQPGMVPAPTGLTAVAQPDRRVVLHWDDVPGADSYRIYEPRTTGPVTEVTASTRTSPSLAPGDYLYSVTTVIDGVESQRSEEVPVTVAAEATEPPAAQPVKVWDVDSTVIPPWTEIHALRPSEQVRVTTDNPFPGTDASVEYRVRQGETGWNRTVGTLRAEVRDSITASGSPTEGTEQFWGTAVYVPADFDWDERGQFFGVLQWHQTANSGNPNIHVWSDVDENSKIDIRGGTGGRTSGDAQFSRTYDLGPAKLGGWDQLTFRFIWSSDDSVGLTEVWRDGVKVLSAQGANKYVDQSLYIKQGIYSAQGVTPGREWMIRGSNVLRGDTFESVQDLGIQD